MSEIWRAVKGYEDIYEVSSAGNVRNKKRRIILKPQTAKNGYQFVKLRTENKLIHRLVAETFIPNPENKTDVNHKNRNKKR